MASLFVSHSVFSRLRCAHRPPFPVYLYPRSLSTTPEPADPSADVEPPFKKYRDSTSVIRSLMSCVKPCPDSPDFRVGPDPWLGSKFETRICLLARAKGRLAARMAVRDYFPNDIAALATEIPRINRLLPLLSPDTILKHVTDGTITPSDGMDRLILLLAPKQAWTLYRNIAPDEEWTDDLLHRLLDLLSCTNGGSSGDHSVPTNFDLSCLAHPDDAYYMYEVALTSMASTSRPKGDPENISSFPNATIDADSGLVDTGAAAESSKVTDVLCGVSGPGIWSPHNPAEQLFLREHERLKTPSGYCSMVRGASKFNNPARALQLAELAWNTAVGNACLDVSTYNILLRSLHYLDVPNVWDVAEPIINRFMASKQAPDVLFFSSILFTLSEFVIRINEPPACPSQLVLKQCVSIGLGLMNELRSLGLEPTMGVMANLLKLLHFARISVHQLGLSDWRNYSLSYLTKNFVIELERRFARHPPSRADHWTLDDFGFFPIAMRIASHERDRNLGKRIDRLLVGTEDRQFFLASSYLARSYAISSLILFLHPTQGTVKPTVQFVHQLDILYRRHKDVVVTTPKTVTNLVKLIEKVFSFKYSNETDNKIRSAMRMAYSILCSLLVDILRQHRLSKKPLKHKHMHTVMNLLTDYASLHPHLAVATSGEVLKLFRLTTTRFSRSKGKLEASESYEDPILVSQLIRMTFPAATEAIQLLGPHQINASQHLGAQKVLTILQDWLAFAVEHQLVSWKWTPSVVGFLHQQDIPSDDLLWNVLQLLAESEFKPLDQEDAKNISNVLEPVLSQLGQLRSGFASGFTDVKWEQRQTLLQGLRRTLQDGCANAKKVHNPYTAELLI